jgi:alkylation response protein AidB-like acyl-CoA dehydrogenase
MTFCKAPSAQRAVWAAKVQTARSARFVGGQAIQLHGGMGMTDELAIGHYYKRLALCETLFGDGEWYLKQIGATATAPKIDCGRNVIAR